MQLKCRFTGVGWRVEYCTLVGERSGTDRTLNEEVVPVAFTCRPLFCVITHESTLRQLGHVQDNWVTHFEGLKKTLQALYAETERREAYRARFLERVHENRLGREAECAREAEEAAQQEAAAVARQVTDVIEID
jgi:hypothetical protein